MTLTSAFLIDLGKIHQGAVRVPGETKVEIWNGLRPAARFRLQSAVEHLVKNGSLNRAYIEKIGEVTTAQASYDIREILKRLPNLMRYDRSRKCYVLANS